ncbi:sensor histidine kinase [Microlunatus sp. GCM10028923]|uniref:sensor histidine kinase n=1 Tax=Microlunatus sp. GCM10028923 TaxID=3273400 RepID=UPI003609FDEC
MSGAELIIGTGRATGVPRRAAQIAAATVLGAVLVPVLLVAVVAAPVSAAPARTVGVWVARRLTRLDGVPRPRCPEGRRLIGLLAVEALLGFVGVCVLGLIGLGLVVAGQMIMAAATGGPVPAFDAGPGQVNWWTVAAFTVPGGLLIFLAACGLAGVAWLDRRAWSRFARPGADELAREVTRLHGTLDDVVAAVDAERRRIERDLHDGVQQRVVALSILLARAERVTDPDERRELQRRARAETQQVLDDLRSVAWRTYPAMLVRDGLPAALAALRDRTEAPIRLRTDLDRLPDLAVEAAAYFVASEAVTNAIKHARATRIDLELVRAGGDVILTVTDDGIGGADPAGAGLSGIASRVAARGGVLRVRSPHGGPTVVEAVIPCG